MRRRIDRPTYSSGAARLGAISSSVAGLQPTVASLLAAAILATLVTTTYADAAPRRRPEQIRYEYVPPKDPSHLAIHEQMKQGRALEHLQQLLSPLRLPYPLTLKVEGCDGVANAWYGEDIVTVCYELLAEILKNAPTQDLPAGVSKADTIIGPVLDVFLHETGHAVFSMWQIPVLGREEDAADQFSAYIMLRLSKDEARRMILGAAYHRGIQMPAAETASSRDTFSDEHSTPAQRAFNVLCIAYGADRKSFADIVEKNLLPKQRAESCEVEYDDLAFAMIKLIVPHIDKVAAKKFHEVWTRTVVERRARLSRQKVGIPPSR